MNIEILLTLDPKFLQKPQNNEIRKITMQLMEMLPSQSGDSGNGEVRDTRVVLALMGQLTSLVSEESERFANDKYLPHLTIRSIKLKVQDDEDFDPSADEEQPHSMKVFDKVGKN